MGVVIKRRIVVTTGYWLDTWYDRRTRSWVIQIKDSENNQIDEAYYCGHVSNVPKAQACMERQVRYTLQLNLACKAVEEL